MRRVSQLAVDDVKPIDAQRWQQVFGLFDLDQMKLEIVSDSRLAVGKCNEYFMKALSMVKSFYLLFVKAN